MYNLKSRGMNEIHIKGGVGFSSKVGRNSIISTIQNQAGKNAAVLGEVLGFFKHWWGPQGHLGVQDV